MTNKFEKFERKVKLATVVTTGYDFHPKSVGETNIYIGGLLGDGVIILTVFLLL